MTNIHNLDLHGRAMRYLRMSITDRCNLDCMYCVNAARQQFIPHASILRYEELLRVASIFQQLGIKKVRITGGEPLVRKGVMEFLSRFRSTLPDLILAITTNAILLPDYLPEISKLGLSSFNISLDSFNSKTFRELTGSDAHARVLKSIEQLLAASQNVKINAVALRGITDVQMDDFIHAVRQMPVDLRFIEYMPMGINTAWSRNRFISSAELKTRIEQWGKLEPVTIVDSCAGPARMYKLDGAKGRIGFISAISDHFCSICQRLRITSEGKLRLCLFGDEEISLANLLRNPKIDDARIAKVIVAAYRKKPLGFERLIGSNSGPVALKQMIGIGG